MLCVAALATSLALATSVHVVEETPAQQQQQQQQQQSTASILASHTLSRAAKVRALVPERTRAHLSHFSHQLWGLSNTADAYGASGGGANCATCTLLLGVFEQRLQIDPTPAEQLLLNFCSWLPGTWQGACDAFIKVYAREIIDGLESRESPDVICHQIDQCTLPQCRLFVNHGPPLAADARKRQQQQQQQQPRHSPAEMRRRRESFARTQHTLAQRAIKAHVHTARHFRDAHNEHVPLRAADLPGMFDPIADWDKDRYSPDPTFRGWDWRGRDCDDADATVHPGRATPADNVGLDIDHNCNGIAGKDDGGTSYELQFCSRDNAATRPIGVGVLGDSAAAHFHIPPEWIDATLMNHTTFSSLGEIASNELDWPMMSLWTGFMNSSYIGHPKSYVGSMHSLYQELEARNRCNHRDYQNIAVNGARVTSVDGDIIKSFARDQANDAPMIMTQALIGNDVCNGHSDTIAHMTKPEDFFNHTIETLNILDKQLPANSHVVLIGLADGRVLWDTMHARIHPIGDLNQDVTYANLYAFLNCLEISPCRGWMNDNATLRNITTEHAVELSAQYQKIIANNSSNWSHFDLHYTPIPIETVLREYEAAGHPAWQLIEPVDGFHPSQTLMNILGAKITSIYDSTFGIVPPVNPHNDVITKTFGNQGGYSN